MIFHWPYLILLFSANIAVAIIIIKNYSSINLLSCINYVFTGLIFEIIFIYQNYNSIVPTTLFFDIIFPICMSASVLIRFTDKYLKPLFTYVITIIVLLLTLDNYNFLAVNYLTAIISLLIITLFKTYKTSPKFINLLDIVISFSLYLMFLLTFMSNKYTLWESSTILNIFHAWFTWYMIITLILINVKFWRHITN